MSGFLYLLMTVGFIGWTVCWYLIGRIDGIQTEKRRAAAVRRMMGQGR